MSPRGIVLCLAAILVVATLAAACGEDSDDAAAPATTEPAVQVAPTAEVQKQTQTAIQSQVQAAPTRVPPSAAQIPAPAPSQPSPSPQSDDLPVLNVVSTSNIVGDWIQRVGGERVSVFSLLPPDADPHTFQPGARDVANVADADMIFSVGLSLESGWLNELVENAAKDHESIVSLGELAEPIEFVDIFGEEGEMHGSAMGRLLIADADEPFLTILDLENGNVIEEAFEVAAPGARVYSSPNYRFGFALARGEGDGDDRAHIFDGGIYLVDHDDHEDLVSEPISMLGLRTTDERPIHFANGGEWSAIFHDGTGRVALINEHELDEDQAEYEISYLNTGLQHGAVVPLPGDMFAVSFANPDYPDKTESSLPIGVEVRGLDDSVIYDDSSDACPGLHGEAHSHDGVAFGCVGGVLFIESHGDEIEHIFIENPSDMRSESRIGTLYGHEEAAVIFGRASYRDGSSFADDGIWMIDPEEGTIESVLPASDAKGSIGASFSADGEALYALTLDGVLNVLDTHDGDIVSEAQLLEAVDKGALPSFIVVGEMLYLADPASQHVIEFSLEDMEIEREWEVHGAPSRLAFLGMISDGEEHPEHGHDEEEDHDKDEEMEEEEEDGHEHEHGALDPHFWFDPLRVQSAVNEITARLSILDPNGAEYYASNSMSYISELSALHTWIEEQVGRIPEENRLLGHIPRQFPILCDALRVQGGRRDFPDYDRN